MPESTIISRIKLYRFDIPLAKPFRIALGTAYAANNILVQIETAGGLSGLGEGSPISYITGETQDGVLYAGKLLAKVLLGHDALAIETCIRTMDKTLPGNNTIKSAFDMALYDILGHYTGLPLVTLLGGEGRIIETDMTIGISSPEVTAQTARQWVDQGFRAIKLKIGTGFDEDIARVRATREAIGPEIALRLDANQSWDVVTSEHTLNALALFDIEFCEQPVIRGDNTGLRYLREHSPIPLMADESLHGTQDAFQLAALGATDYFNIKLPKAGGIAHALDINAVGKAAGIRCMVGSMMETRLGLSAAAHLVAAQPNIIFADLDTVFELAEDPIIGGITFDGPTITLSDAPGHGANVDHDWLKTQEVFTIIS